MEQITTVGIDLAKKVFLAAWSGRGGQDSAAPNGAARAAGGNGGLAIALHDRHGGLLRGA